MPLYCGNACIKYLLFWFGQFVFHLQTVCYLKQSLHKSYSAIFLDDHIPDSSFA